MKIAIKTVDKIRSKGYKFTYISGSKCFIEKSNGSGFAHQRPIYFDTPTQALKYIS